MIILNVYLGLLLLSSILSIFFKPDFSKTYCGIYAFSGAKKMSGTNWAHAISGIRMMGIYNDSRGGDNFGIYYNNKVFHNTNFHETTFKKYMEENPEFFTNFPTNSSNIIGHSRKGSVGTKELKNAHPFEISAPPANAGDQASLIGVHNGTISNWKDLLKKYEVDEKNITVDSKAIFSILAKNRYSENPFKVLEEYIGAGTFIWSYSDEPNKIYVFRGESPYYKGGKMLSEERPLFWLYYPNAKGFFFSSMKEPLKMFAAVKDIKTTPANIVYVIEDNKILSETAINRLDKGGQKDTIEYTHTSYGTENGCGFDYPMRSQSSSVLTKSANTTTHVTKTVLNTIYYDKDFLFKNNAIKLDGIFVVDPATGMIKKTYYVSNKIETIMDDFLNIYKKQGFLLLFATGGYLFKTVNGYLYSKNIMSLMKTKTDIVDKIEDFKKISKHLLFPAKMDTKEIFYYNGDVFDGAFKPYFYYLSGKATVKIKGGAHSSTTTSSTDKESYTILINKPDGSLSVSHCSFIDYTKDMVNHYLTVTKSVKETLDKVNNTQTKNEVTTFTDLSKVHVKALPEVDTLPDTSQIEEDLETDFNENYEMFILAEKEVLDEYNNLKKAVEMASACAEKVLKIADWKNYLSFHLNDWILNTIEQSAIHPYTENYVFDAKLNEYNLVDKDADLF